MEQKELIGICIDIRKSTKLVNEKGLEKAAKLIINFIEQIYKELQKVKNIENRARHQGDGVLISLPIKDNEKVFNHVKDLLKNILPIIKNEKNFDVGIGIDLGLSIEERIEGSPHRDKTLIVGNSLSTSVKVCSQVPFRNGLNNKYYIKATKSFLSKANWEEDQLKWNAKKTMAFVNFL
ncbi:MAG: hypothetical protein ACRDA7_01350 [Metamycoplasmataceae bacterium]